MISNGATFLAWSLQAGMAMAGVAFLLLLYRFIKGPSLPDRVVALDLLAVLSVGFMAMASMVTADPVFLDPAIALALIAFLGTVAFAKYIEKRGERDE